MLQPVSTYRLTLTYLLQLKFKSGICDLHLYKLHNHMNHLSTYSHHGIMVQKSERVTNSSDLLIFWYLWKSVIIKTHRKAMCLYIMRNSVSRGFFPRNWYSKWLSLFEGFLFYIGGGVWNSKQQGKLHRSPAEYAMNSSGFKFIENWHHFAIAMIFWVFHSVIVVILVQTR